MSIGALPMPCMGTRQNSGAGRGTPILSGARMARYEADRLKLVHQIEVACRVVGKNRFDAQYIQAAQRVHAKLNAESITRFLSYR
jgi:hypothetical protein